jgi:hypothetical protein
MAPPVLSDQGPDHLTYRDTTRTQWWRAAGLWSAGVGAGLFIFVSGQLLRWTSPELMTVPGVMLVGGAAAYLLAKRHLAELDAHNRPFLLSSRGTQAMRNRAATMRRLRVWRAWLGTLFFLMGSAFILLLSGLTCESVHNTEGLCGAIPRLTDLQFNLWRSTTLGLGVGFIATWVLMIWHEQESERLDVVVAEGQRRRAEGPIPGLKRTVWDY